MSSNSNAVRRRAALLCLLSCVCLLLSGCAQPQQAPAPTASVTPTRPPATVTPVPTLLNDPAMLYENVLTDKRVTSIVLEGFTDDASMLAVLKRLKQQQVPAVFFISGIVANEHPQTVRAIADSGFAVGNYGLNALKDMQDNDIPANLHQFRRGQELIAEATGLSPTLFRCNGSTYTREVLQAAAAVGLTAGVKPNAFINHASFDSYEEAELFAQRLTRGSILSIKLGQVLDAEEFGGLTYSMNNRAIDPEPFLSDNMEDTIAETYANITNVVGWLLDALDAQQYTVLSPEALQAERITMFDSPHTLSEATLAMLDADAYALPVTDTALDYLVSAHPATTTPAPSETPAKNAKPTASETASPSPVANGVVLVGDSLTGGLQSYVQWRRDSDPAYLPQISFLTSANFSIGGSQMLISDTSVHPLLNGVPVYVAEGIARLKAKTVLLMPGQADVRTYTISAFLDNLKLMVYQIRKRNPDAEVWLQLLPPGVADRYTLPDNLQLFAFNLAVYRFCREFDIPCLDVAYPLRDSQGDLPASLCLDADTAGIHLNDTGCDLWLSTLLSRLP